VTVSLQRISRVVLVVMINAAVTSCSGSQSPAPSKSAPTPTPASTTSATVAAPAPASPPPPPKTDEQQIRDVLQTEQDAYNTSNWALYRSVVCEHMRQEFSGPGEAAMEQGRQQTGLLDVLVGTITVHGDEASVVVTQHQERGTPPNTGSFRLVREADGWKVCIR
jgi:hypothetical protein